MKSNNNSAGIRMLGIVPQQYPANVVIDKACSGVPYSPAKQKMNDKN
jgi:hypothetical protein